MDPYDQPQTGSVWRYIDPEHLPGAGSAIIEAHVTHLRRGSAGLQLRVYRLDERGRAVRLAGISQRTIGAGEWRSTVQAEQWFRVIID